MALIIGVDSYVTSVEADAYVQSHYLSTDAQLTEWTSASDSNKEVLLRRAALYIDALPLQGVKADVEQTMSFPRITNLLNTSTAIPEEVKSAQVEQALYFLGSATSKISATSRAEMRRQGVKSFSLGDLSETYETATLSDSYSAVNECPKQTLVLMAKWITGGFRICRY